jgi:N-acyl-D-aspartate/D-glutamate deacylase
MVGGPGFGVEEFEALALLSRTPVTWCSLHEGVQGGRHWELSDATSRARARGSDLWAQMSCLPVVSQFTLARPYVLESVPAFGELSALPVETRRASYRDASWRRRALEEITRNREGRTFAIDFERMVLAESASSPEIVGRSVGELARDRGHQPMDVFVELGLEDGLATRFDLIMFNSNEDTVAQLLARDSTILGLSDAGAHTSQLCDASFAVHLLGRFVRERRDLDLEFAVWRLTGHPAEVFGFADRGLLKRGYVADVCVFNPATIGEGPRERVYDQPGGADRLIKQSIGVEHVLVNGTMIRRDGVPIANAAPGRVLR